MLRRPDNAVNLLNHIKQNSLFDIHYVGLRLRHLQTVYDFTTYVQAFLAAGPIDVRHVMERIIPLNCAEAAAAAAAAAPAADDAVN